MAVVLALVARPVAVLVSTIWFRWPIRQMVFLSWAGLRGAVPIVLATFPLTARYEDGRLIFNIVFFVVLVSATVQGTTLAWLAPCWASRARPRSSAASVELSPVDTTSADIVDLELTEHAAVLDQPRPGGAANIAFMPAGARRVRVDPGELAIEAGDRSPFVALDVLRWR